MSVQEQTSTVFDGAQFDAAAEVARQAAADQQAQHEAHNLAKVWETAVHFGKFVCSMPTEAPAQRWHGNKINTPVPTFDAERTGN
jgi:hypothetical protein